jgi:TPR repeat protein
MKKKILLLTCVAIFAHFGLAHSGALEGGQAAYDRGDHSEAFRLWKPLADQGNAVAQNSLGGMYANGQGVPQDDREAMRWLRKAADQGLAEAQYNLGWMYRYGLGEPEDNGEAVKCFRQAADQGFALAQITLGYMYAEGDGVPQDDGEAVKCFRQAADQGDALAQATLGAAYAEGLGVPQDDREAVRWLRRAAEQIEAPIHRGVFFPYPLTGSAYAEGVALAQLGLGAAYAEGLGVSQDDEAAVDWYYKAGMSFLEIGETGIHYGPDLLFSRDKAMAAYDAIQEINTGHPLGKKLKKAIDQMEE